MVKYVLSLDGGGVKGIFICLFLEHLFRDLRAINPIDYKNPFDMFAGVSIGGYIAAALSCDPECKIDEILTIEQSRVVCDKSIWDRIVGIAQIDPKYDGKGKRKTIEERFTNKVPIKDCLLLTYNLTKMEPVIYRSWEPDSISLIDTIDAGSSVPVYFPPKKIGNSLYIDGGVSCNNPVELAYLEAWKKYPNEEIRILSIGTGVSSVVCRCTNNPESWTNLRWITTGITEIIIQASSQFQNHLVKENLGAEYYFRVNTSKLSEIEMDDTSDDIYIELENIAKELYNENKEKLLEFLTKK